MKDEIFDKCFRKAFYFLEPKLGITATSIVLLVICALLGAVAYGGMCYSFYLLVNL